MCGFYIGPKNFVDSPVAHRGIESSTMSFLFGDTRLNTWATRLPLQTVEGDSFGSPIELREGILWYVGEIYNYDHSAFSSDVEFIISQLEYGGINYLLKISKNWDGMWAIAFYDRFLDKMFCFTDPLGKKQLYYGNGPTGSLELCSEIRPLLWPDSKFDLFYKSEVFKWGYNIDDRTPWQDIHRIMPNVVYVFDGCIKAPKILTINQTDWKGEDISLSPEALRLNILRATKDRLITTGAKIGLMLSGGLDSSIIAACLKELKADVKLIAINNGEDYEYAQLMADHIGMPLETIEYDPEELSDDEIWDFFKWNETPIDLGSVIPNQIMFSHLKDTPIVLSGDGADELFGGYRRIDDYDSQLSDVFQELSFYHLPRLDRACNRYTIELRNPFLSHQVIKQALQIPYEYRMHKQCLKEAFKDLLPKRIIERAKLPLKNKALREDPLDYRKKVFNIFYSKSYEDFKNSQR